MRILSWLLGKMAKPVTATDEGRTSIAPKPSGDSEQWTATPHRNEEPGKQAPANPEIENLRRWRESGQARAWVEERQGCWNHDDWTALLEKLTFSSFWPMNPDAVGLALEEARREWLQRN